MPQLIASPESLRRKTQADVCFIAAHPDRSFIEDSSSFDFPPALADWLRVVMPDVAWGAMEPSESDWLLGGPRSFYLTLTKEQVAECSAFWERPDPHDAAGRQRDECHGFRCYVRQFDLWRRRMDACAIHRGVAAPDAQRFIAWDTVTEGPIWALMASAGEVVNADDPTQSPLDLRHRALECFPSLREPKGVDERIVEILVERRKRHIECMVVSSPDIDDRDVFNADGERGARSAWQKHFCKQFGLPESEVHFCGTVVIPVF